MKQVEEWINILAEVEETYDRTLVFSNVIYSHINEEIESAIKNRDGRLLLTLRQFREVMTKNMKLHKVDFKTTELAPFLFFVKDLPKEAPKTSRPEKTKSVRKDDSIKYNALNHILKQLPFDIYDECVSKQRSKGFFMNKEQLLKKIIETPELKSLFPKGTNIGKLSKEGLCKEIFKN
jgi:hypothetical protein